MHGQILGPLVCWTAYLLRVMVNFDQSPSHMYAYSKVCENEATRNDQRIKNCLGGFSNADYIFFGKERVLQAPHSI